MKICPLGLDLLKGREKLKLCAYRDQGTGKGRWTIGWGHTGVDVYEGLCWTEAEADATLLEDLAIAERTVNSSVHHELNQNQFSALVVLVFNIGSGAFFASSILRLLNDGNFEGACRAFGLYNKVHLPGGAKVVSDGLVSRRAEEQALFRTPVLV